MQAKRIRGYSELDESICSYWKTAEGDWLISIPKCGLGNLRGHSVEEHSDGTISVTPSILIKAHYEGNDVQVHGYLTHGVWREC